MGEKVGTKVSNILFTASNGDVEEVEEEEVDEEDEDDTIAMKAREAIAMTKMKDRVRNIERGFGKSPVVISESSPSPFSSRLVILSSKSRASPIKLSLRC